MPIAEAPAAPGPVVAPPPPTPPPAAVAPARVEVPPAVSAPPPAPAAPATGARNAYAIDLNSILGDDSQVKPAATQPETQEVDLSSVLHDLKEGAASAAGQPAKSLESVLKGLRDEAVHDASPETAEQHFKLAGTYMEMGMQDEAIKALEVAARSPRHRFRAGAMLGKAFLDAGDQANAIEWFSRAVEAPAPTPQAQHALLYDLAVLLDANGESARALAVFLELQSEAGEYRDVSSRLEQLKVQMGS
jgi:tetratricopeptide (TPR) repeat protein